MKHSLPSLESLKAFESAARHLSFSLAAEELCITKGGISYQIRKLEQDIDCLLFKRSVRQVYLTDAGQKLLQTTQRVFSELNQTINQFAQKNKDLSVIMAASTYVALRWLSPRIASFNELYPNVSIVLQHSVNSANFNLQDVDIAISWCRCGEHRKSANKYEMPMPLFPVCSPNLLSKFNISSATNNLPISQFCSNELKSIPLLCEDRRLDLWQQWAGNTNDPLTNPRRIIIDANVRTQAAIDGQGWTMADDLMKQELFSGVLVAPFKHQLHGYGYALKIPQSKQTNHNANALQKWLIAWW